MTRLFLLCLLVAACDCSKVTPQTCTLRCETPPPNQCIDGNVVREFAAPGTCPVDECVYTYTDRQCTFACRDGMCLADSGSGGGTAATGGGTAALGGGTSATGGGSGTTGGGSGATGGGSGATGGGSAMVCSTACNTPPGPSCANGVARTYAAQGACTNGQCTYGYADVGCGFGCSGTACAADPCAQVTCTPPPDSCPSANVARHYAHPGTCSGGTCGFPYADVSCGFGCTGGVCNAPTCGTTVCNAVPAGTCVDTKTRRQFEIGNGCDAGKCSYPSLDSYCSEGCLNGQCIAGSDETFWLLRDATDLTVDSSGLTHFVICGGAVVYQWLAEGNFGFETIPMSSNCDAAHIAVTPSGQPVVVWYDTGNQDLRYAERTGPGQWTVELIANSGDVGRINDIVVDSAGTRWAVWTDQTQHQVRGGRRTSPGVWSSALVYSGDFEEYFGFFRLILGPSGAPVAMLTNAQYGDGGVHTEIYGLAGTSWSKLDHLDAPAISIHTSAQGQLELDYQRASFDAVFRTYTDAGPTEEHVGQFTGTLTTTAAGTALMTSYDVISVRADGEWTERGLATPPWHSIATGPRVAVDPPDRRVRALTSFDYNPGYTVEHACVPDCSNRGCGGDGCGGTCGSCGTGQFCAQGQCGPWDVETVPLVNVSALGNSIGVRPTASGLIGIDLYGSGNLYEFIGGTWKVTPTGFTPWSVSRQSMAVDAANRLLLTWLDSAHSTLYLGTHDATGWSQQTVSTTATSAMSSLALTPGGSARVVFAEQGKLRFATQGPGGALTAQDITPLTGQVSSTAVVLDAAGSAHVVFIQSTSNGHLELDEATDATGSWVVSTIRADLGTSSSWQPPQLLLGAGDVLHLAFRDQVATVLVYASKAPGGSWQFETVPNTSHLDTRFSLVLYPSGPALVHPQDGASDTLLLRRRTGANAFASETVPQKAYGFDFAVDGTGTLQGLLSYAAGVPRHARRF